MNERENAAVGGAELAKRLSASASEILSLSRGLLLAELRFLDMAVGYLEPEISMAAPTATVATDGRRLYCNAGAIAQMYARERSLPTRAYLHATMHCVFRHMMFGKRIDCRLWSIAADLAVEHAILSLSARATETEGDAAKREALAPLAARLHTVSAERVYRYLLSEADEAETERLAALFCVDDHVLWFREEASVSTAPEAEGIDSDEPHDRAGADRGADSAEQSEDRESEGGEKGEGDAERSDPDGKDGRGQDAETGLALPEMTAEEAAELWREVSERMQVELETVSKLPGNRAGALVKSLEELHRERYDYRSFLTKFATRTEVMELDPDEFDYIYYTYGLSLYKNLPLIEPLEYREAKRIREFVIAIDTSGSTYHSLVQRFLEKTYNILCETETFDSRIRVRILQCDAVVQSETVVTSQKGLREYIGSLEIHGGGGTDFRPVFEHVQALLERRELRDLKGLIYLTDGWGVYPKEKPPYETVFVFVEDEENNLDEVPAWAIKLVLDADELK